MRRGFLVFSLFVLGGFAALAQGQASNWVGTWAASPVGSAVNEGQPGPGNTTYRNIVHISLGGPAVRVQLTNEFGTQPLTVGAAHVAISAGGGGAIQTNTDHALTFNGKPTVEIPAGAFVVSDPVTMQAAPLSDLAVSVYVPEQRIRNTTCHSFADSTNYVLQGDATAAATADKSNPIYAWCFVKGIDVKTDGKAAAIVTFGDSITDGAQGTRDANGRWPDVLAARLQADKNRTLGVLNEGIGGNRVLHDGYGPSALARFDRDVIAQSGVKYLIILEGINDIGRLKDPHEQGDNITADDLIFGLTQLVTRAHQHGIKVFGATLTPYLPTGYSSPQGEQVRQAYNQWIRTSGIFDGVIDFDKITQDPANPGTFLPAYDSGDHLHPGDAGYKAMGDAIDLSLFH